MLRQTLVAVLATSTLLVGCGGGDSEAPTPETETPQSVTVYSGRNESLIQPLLDRFTEQSGIEVRVRYGGTAELAATLLEEGPGTPADVYISQDAAALGALSAAGLLTALPEEVLAKIPERFVSPQGDWVGLSGRARVVVYNPEMVTPEELPQSLDEVADERFRGNFGVAPTNASFQAHMAAYGSVHGQEALDTLLRGMASNAPRPYPKNSAIVEAVTSGEVPWGLVNHYYLWRALKEDPEASGKNYFMPEGEISSFVNLAGAATLGDSPAARELLAYLVSEDAQRYFAQETFEYPLARGAEAAVGLAPLSEVEVTQVDFAQVSEVFEETLEAISRSGLLP